MKLKAGDKVVIRDDLVVGRSYSGFGFHADMECFKSKIVTISYYSNRFKGFLITDNCSSFGYDMIAGKLIGNRKVVVQ